MIISISHKNSRLNEELQALDLISGSIFSMIEKNDSTYFDILQSKNCIIDGTKLIAEK